jgi:hypothetical protein
MRINREGANPVPSNLRFAGNLWADPVGSMGGFRDTLPGDSTQLVLQRNGYWNGGNPLPSDPGELVNIGNDATAVIGNPSLPSPAALVTPWWNPVSGNFNDG